MTTQGRTVLVGWRKSWITASSTYLVEVGPETVWMGRLGSGGAYWEPDYLSLAMGTNLEANKAGASLNPMAAGGAALGKAIGDRVLNRYQKEIATNAARYEVEGRRGLDHKANLERPKSEFAAGSWLSKAPAVAPAAIKNMPGPILGTELAGKTWLFLGIPSAPPIEEFWAAIHS